MTAGGEPLLPPSRRVSKRIIGVLIVLAIASATLATNILGKEVLAGHSPVPPFMLAYFNVCFDVVGFGVARGFKPRDDGARRLEHRQLAKAALLLMLIFQAGNVTYFIGLQMLAQSIQSLLYQSTTVWVALFSLAILRDAVDPFKGAALVFTLAGVVWITLDNWNDGGPGHAGAFKVHMAVLCLSAALWALYEVLVKKLLPDATPREVAQFVGWRGLLNLVLLWPIVLGLWLSGVERVGGLTTAQLGGVGAMALLSVVSTYLIVGGITMTSPLFIRIGATLIAPLSIGWDVYSGYSPGWRCYLGCALVIVGFAFINLTWSRPGCVCHPCGRPTQQRTQPQQALLNSAAP